MKDSRQESTTYENPHFPYLNSFANVRTACNQDPSAPTERRVSLSQSPANCILAITSLHTTSAAIHRPALPSHRARPPQHPLSPSIQTLFAKRTQFLLPTPTNYNHLDAAKRTRFPPSHSPNPAAHATLQRSDLFRERQQTVRQATHLRRSFLPIEPRREGRPRRSQRSGQDYPLPHGHRR